MPPRSARDHPGFRHVVVSLEGGPSGPAAEHVGLFALRDFLIGALG